MTGDNNDPPASRIPGLKALWEEIGYWDNRDETDGREFRHEIKSALNTFCSAAGLTGWQLPEDHKSPLRSKMITEIVEYIVEDRLFGNWYWPSNPKDQLYNKQLQWPRDRDEIRRILRMIIIKLNYHKRKNAAKKKKVNSGNGRDEEDTDGHHQDMATVEIDTHSDGETDSDYEIERSIDTPKTPVEMRLQPDAEEGVPGPSTWPRLRQNLHTTAGSESRVAMPPPKKPTPIIVPQERAESSNKRSFAEERNYSSVSEGKRPRRDYDPFFGDDDDYQDGSRNSNPEAPGVQRRSPRTRKNLSRPDYMTGIQWGEAMRSADPEEQTTRDSSQIPRGEETVRGSSVPREMREGTEATLGNLPDIGPIEEPVDPGKEGRVGDEYSGLFGHFSPSPFPRAPVAAMRTPQPQPQPQSSPAPSVNNIRSHLTWNIVTSRKPLVMANWKPNVPVLQMTFAEFIRELPVPRTSSILYVDFRMTTGSDGSFTSSIWKGEEQELNFKALKRAINKFDKSSVSQHDGRDDALWIDIEIELFEG